MCTTIRLETQEKRRKERRRMDGGDEREKERKRVKEGPVTASHLLDLISFRLHNSLPKQPCCYACFTDEEPEAYRR